MNKPTEIIFDHCAETVPSTITKEQFAACFGEASDFGWSAMRAIEGAIGAALERSPSGRVIVIPAEGAAFTRLDANSPAQCDRCGSTEGVVAIGTFLYCSNHQPRSPGAQT